jgi:hypothetical protein
MSLAIIGMPENVTELRGWLERELIGLRLRQVVTELIALLGDEHKADSGSIEAICGEQLSAVLERGLSALPDAQVRELLRHPRLLYELQDKLLVDRTAYWRGLQSAELNQVIKEHWPPIEAALDQHTISASEPVRPRSIVTSATNKRRRTGWIAFASALAAMLLIGFFVVQSRIGNRAAMTSWGWGRSGALAVDMPAPAYLNHLAGVAQEWSRERPETKEGLARRLRELRTNCDALIAAPHPPLVAADRAWLVERCRAWATTFDQQLVELQTGKKAIVDVQAEADATVNKLITALRERAKAV